MLIYVNSTERETLEGTSVHRLLELLDFAQKRVAVEVNAELVVKSEWATHLLKSGDRVEVVSFVGGG